MKMLPHTATCTLALALVAAGFSYAVHAQTPASPKIEPGLWELTVALKSQDGVLEAAIRQAQEQIKLLPPDERKRVEEMMASRGVQLGERVSTLNVCISREDAERGVVPQQSTECAQQVLESSGTRMKVKFKCTANPPTSGSIS